MIRTRFFSIHFDECISKEVYDNIRAMADDLLNQKIAYHGRLVEKQNQFEKLNEILTNAKRDHNTEQLRLLKEIDELKAMYNYQLHELEDKIKQLTKEKEDASDNCLFIHDSGNDIQQVSHSDSSVSKLKHSVLHDVLASQKRKKKNV